MNSLCLDNIMATKSKTNKVREVAGCVPFRVSNGILELLVITARSRGDWIFPKGGVEKDELPKDTATRETLEEAGISGNVIASHGSFKFLSSRRKRPSKMFVFLLEVTEVRSEWNEMHERKRKWVPIGDVSSMVERPEYLAMLKLAVESSELQNSMREAGVECELPCLEAKTWEL
eukprot:253883_1